MKKSYVKPEVTFVRFELSEAIASCGTKVYNNHASHEACNGYSDQMKMIMERTGATLVAEDSCSVVLEGYCYFTSTSMLMNS